MRRADYKHLVLWGSSPHSWEVDAELPFSLASWFAFSSLDRLVCLQCPLYIWKIDFATLKRDWWLVRTDYLENGWISLAHHPSQNVQITETLRSNSDSTMVSQILWKNNPPSLKQLPVVCAELSPPCQAAVLSANNLQEMCAIALAKKPIFLVYLNKTEFVYTKLQRKDCAELLPGGKICKGNREKWYF